VGLGRVITNSGSADTEMTLEEAINAAAAQLPPGAEITINVERDAATVYVSDWDGNVREFDSADMSIPDQVLDCIRWCEGREQNIGVEPSCGKASCA